MSDVPTLIRNLSFALIPFILSLTVHEYAHAWMATKLGDDTAKMEGRLTLSPGAHIDPFGTLIIPTLSVIFGGLGFIAWAKPVPFNPVRFRRGVSMRLGSAMVAAAGPLSNVLLAIVSIALMVALARANVPMLRPVESGDGYVMLRTPIALLLTAMWQRNVTLAIFNLIPFPPLDGHYLLPRAFDPIIKPMSRYGFGILMIVFMFVPGADGIFSVPLAMLSGLLSRTFGVY